MRYVKHLIWPSLLLFAIAAGTAVTPTPTYTYEVVKQYPHDPTAFTQGLVLTSTGLYESTGLYGQSTLRKIDLETGSVIMKEDVPPEYFAEGMTIFQDKIFQLTWQSHVAFVYDPVTFAHIGQFSYEGEGWGLTHDGQYLIMSDGTNQIRFVNAATFQTVKTISVYDEQQGAVANLNELEYINGEIYANVWQTNWIVRIDPETGHILGWIDFTGLLAPGTPADVLNGIAYDQTSGHLLVTGKYWPTLFEVIIVPTTPGGTSPDGTLVPPATQIVDSAGAVWTIAATGAILRNGVQAAGGSGSKVLLKNTKIYVLGTDNNWWEWTGSGWINVGPEQPGGGGPPPGGGNTSPDGTSVPPATQIVDNASAVWTIAGNGAILWNGVQAGGGSGSKILWKNSTIYVLGSDNNWWEWTVSGWINVGPQQPGGGGPPPGGGNTSPDGTTVPPATQVVDNASAVWTIAGNGAILWNGSQAAGGSGSKILWKNSKIYVLGSDNNWWEWTGSGWINLGPEPPPGGG